MIEYAIQYGYTGMFVSAFIAGSFLPFSSEAVMVALVAAGLNPVTLLLYATVGNWGGSMFNYWIGRQAKMEWIERYLRVKPEKLAKAQHFMGDKGAWVGVFSFLPVIGTAICVALGLMRANPSLTAISVLIGKVIRYVVIALSSTIMFH
jgi:membrane protein YqaA with SNARE-associated domain